MIKEGKIWGTTQTLFSKNNVEFHRIEIKKGYECSKHKHNHKFNAFYIESGLLKVKVWKNNYALVDETIIKTGEMTVVKPGEFHQFESLEDTIAYEIYWTEIESDDIERETCGKKIGE
jgi:mannose-6-phosphate isomerase-like protein (cupin superfamily)